MQPKIDQIDLVPDVSGRHGKAWRAHLAAALARAGIKPENDAGLVVWIVEAPWAHPAWHSYAIVCVHLRPMADKRPTKIYLDGATHEIWVYALDPRGKRQALIENPTFGAETCQFLTPCNFAAQFIEPSDDAARGRVEAAVRAICDGALSPDTDFVRHWAHLFGSNMMKDRAGETRIIFGDPEKPAVEIVIPPHPGPQDRN